jgi:lysophospholipase L1-like esterase
MLLSSLFRSSRVRAAGRGRPAFQPGVESLEGRCVPAAAANPAVVPAPNPASDWVAETHIVTARPRGDPRVIFLGDSITEFFADGAGAHVWRTRVAPLQADNFGVRSSNTANVLYAINEGLLSNLNSKVVVLMIGINNLLAGQTPQQTAAGVAACLADIHVAQPQARILLLGLLPAGWKTSDPLRVKVEQTNALLPALADGKVVSYADVGGGLLRRDGSIAPGMLIDGIHPTERGYRSIAANLDAALFPLLRAPRLPVPPAPGAHDGSHRRM